MNVEEMAKKMAGEEVARHYRMINSRSIETIIPRLLHQFADNKTLSGNHEFSIGVMNIVTEYNNNPTFRDAVKTIAQTIITLFPPEKTTKVDLSDDEDEQESATLQ